MGSLESVENTRGFPKFQQEREQREQNFEQPLDYKQHHNTISKTSGHIIDYVY